MKFFTEIVTFLCLSAGIHVQTQSIVWYLYPGKQEVCVGDDVSLVWTFLVGTEVTTSFLQTQRRGDTLVSCSTIDPAHCVVHTGYQGRINVVEMSQTRVEYKLKNVRKTDSSKYVLRLSGPKNASYTATLDVFSPEDLTAKFSIQNVHVPWNSTYVYEGCCGSLPLLVQTRNNGLANITLYTRSGILTSCFNATSCTHAYSVVEGDIFVKVDYGVCQPFKAHIYVEVAGTGGLGAGFVVIIVLVLLVVLTILVLALLICLHRRERIPAQLKCVEAPLDKVVNWAGFSNTRTDPPDPISPVSELTNKFEKVNINESSEPSDNKASPSHSKPGPSLHPALQKVKRIFSRKAKEPDSNLSPKSPTTPKPEEMALMTDTSNREGKLDDKLKPGPFSVPLHIQAHRDPKGLDYSEDSDEESKPTSHPPNAGQSKKPGNIIKPGKLKVAILPPILDKLPPILDTLPPTPYRLPDSHVAPVTKDTADDSDESL